MTLWIQNREKAEQHRQAKWTSKERFKREQCGCCRQACEGRPTHLYMRSKCKASSFISNSSENSPHLWKLAAKWVPHKLSDEQKRQRVNDACDLLSRFELDEPKCVMDVITGDETRVPFYSIASKCRKTKHGWNQMTRDTKSTSPDFRAGRGCLPSSSTTRGLWQLMFCLLTVPPQGHIMQKQLSP